MVKKCIVRGCSSSAVLRGCCNNHYHRMYRAIRVGAVKSWSEAARNGLAVAVKSKPGPKRV